MRARILAHTLPVAEEMSLDYHEPTSIREAVALGVRFGEESRFLAGGTDLMIQIHRGRCAPRQVVSLHRVPWLDAIDVDGAIAIGALVTHRRLEHAPAFQGALRALVESAEVIGGHPATGYCASLTSLSAREAASRIVSPNARSKSRPTSIVRAGLIRTNGEACHPSTRRTASEPRRA